MHIRSDWHLWIRKYFLLKFSSVLLEEEWVDPAGEQQVTQLILTTRILLLWPCDPSLSIKDCWGEMGSTLLRGSKASLTTDWPTGWELLTKSDRERNDDDPQPIKEGVDCVLKQRLQDFTNRRALLMHNTEGGPRRAYACNKEVPVGQHYKESFHPFSGKSAWPSTCLSANTHSVENRQ